MSQDRHMAFRQKLRAARIAMVAIFGSTISYVVASPCLGNDDYCTDVKDEDKLQGNFVFEGSNNVYISQFEGKSVKGKVTYRYCVENVHKYTPIYVIWDKDRGEGKRFEVFNSPVPQQKRTAQVHEDIAEVTHGSMDLRYGRTTKLGSIKEVDTLHRQISINNLLQFVQFSQSNESSDLSKLLGNKNELDALMQSGRPITLKSSATVYIPSNEETESYMTGKSSTQPKKFEFVPIRITFSSIIEVQGTRLFISNKGSYDVQPDFSKQFISSKVIPLLHVEIDSKTRAKMGQFEIGPDKPFAHSVSQGTWVAAYQPIQRAIGRDYGRVELKTPYGTTISALSFAFFEQ